MTTLRKATSWLLPFLVSGGTLAFLLSRIEMGGMLEQLSARVMLILVPALLAFGAISLFLEAVSIKRLEPPSQAAMSLWICARVKAASYTLALINYAIGAGSLVLLLRRRLGVPVAEAAAVVILISLADLSVLMLLTGVGIVLSSAEAPAVQAGVLVAAIGGIVLGFAALRFPRSLGPLDRLRELEIFRVAREAPLRVLIELAGLRLVFVSVFIAMGGCALLAFGISVPPADLIVNFAAVALVSALPIAVAGLGTGQAMFVYAFRHWAEPDSLLACSLALSAGIILLRAALGLTFAREFTREAIVAAREEAG